MAIPRFFDRVVQAVAGVINGVDAQQLATTLGSTVVLLSAGREVDEQPQQRVGFLALASVAARLYPSIAVDAPDALFDETAALVRAISPRCDVGRRGSVGAGTRVVTVGWGSEVDTPGVSVHADGWHVVLDQPPAGGVVGPCEAGSAIAAAAVGGGELFRACFADLLPGGGRTAPTPVTWNVITMTEWHELPRLGQVEMGRTHLVGAGAIGQAFMLALSASPVTGTLVVVDHELVDLSNLQRYILTVDGDEGAPKTEVATRWFAGTGVTVEPVPARWGEDPACRDVQTLVVALDSGSARIAAQASLPEVAFNAFTGPLEGGWSLHPNFGHAEPCVACLYWPRGPGHTTVQHVANALGVNERRIEIYMTLGHPVGLPLPPEAVARAGVGPAGAAWAGTPLLNDVAEGRGMPSTLVEQLRALPVDHLFQRVACGAQQLTDLDGVEVQVPVAHQSLLVGAMLAVQRIAWAVPDLRHALPDVVEHRLPALREPAAPYPLDQRPAPGCLCRDAEFVAVHRDRWTGG